MGLGDIFRSWGIRTPGGIIERFINMRDGSFAKTVAVRPFSDNAVARAAGIVDNATVDAFGRVRLSEPQAIFSAKQIHDNLPLIFDDIEFSGSGTGSQFNANRASSLLSVADSTRGIQIRSQKTYNNYQPGKSQLAIFTGVLGKRENGITRQIGLFDVSNGLFFQLKDEILSVVIRSNVSGSIIDRVFAQDDWNQDKLDGTGPSGVLITPSFCQIFFIDYEWLGSGRVRFGLFINGIPLYVHDVNHANSKTAVYMSRPNLPISYLISNDGSGPEATLEAICATVVSEGGQEGNSQILGVSRGSNGFVTSNMAELFPLISIRLKSTHLDSTVNVVNLSISVGGNNRFEVILLLNPLVNGIDNTVWTDLDDSAIQFNIDRINTNSLTDGTDLGGAIADGKIESLNEMLLKQNILRLGSTILGKRDEIVLAIRMLPAANTTVFARLDIEELI